MQATWSLTGDPQLSSALQLVLLQFIRLADTFFKRLGHVLMSIADKLYKAEINGMYMLCFDLDLINQPLIHVLSLPFDPQGSKELE